MKLRLCVSGKLRNSPELMLFNKYRFRTEKIGKSINVPSIIISEYEGVKWTEFLKTVFSTQSFSTNSHKVLLDERGKIVSSISLSEILRSHRDSGTQEFIFFIGGAEGVPEKIWDNFDEIFSFGKMVWPHALVRVMIAEQLYRAASILAGSPYHRT